MASFDSLIPSGITPGKTSPHRRRTYRRTEPSDGPTKTELQAQARALGLSTTGTKAEIAERLEAAQTPADDEQGTSVTDDEIETPSAP